jgi:UDP-2,3-diacylglucosamine hydrolase
MYNASIAYSKIFMALYFIADLHLSDRQPHLLKLFEHFIQNILMPNDTLYILGDLFEYWIGSNKNSTTDMQIHRLLKTLKTRKIKWFFLAGNRDFLIGKKLLKNIHGIPLAEKALIDLDGQPTLLLHGDTLCTFDLAYQAFRHKVQQKWLQRLFLSLPFFIRKNLVVRMRKKSEQSGQVLDKKMMDVAEHTVLEEFHAFNANIMIHGHVHLPGIHRYWDEQKQQWLTRYVLADWDAQGNYLCYNNQQLTLAYFRKD